MTFRLKSRNSTDLAGFINTLTANGYQVTFREGGNHNILMADVDNDSCKIRNASKLACGEILEELDEHKHSNMETDK